MKKLYMIFKENYIKYVSNFIYACLKRKKNYHSYNGFKYLGYKIK